MSPRGRPPATDRVRRLLALVPWLVARGGAPIDEIARRFVMTRDEVVRDLELAACCGLPPYTGEVLIDFLIEGDEVKAWPSDIFARPPRLSPGEGFAVLASGRALLGVPGAGGQPAGALVAALDKLEAALGATGRLAVDLSTPPHLDALRGAADEGRRVHVVYWSAWRDELTDRDIDPDVVYTRNGRWYVDAFDHSIDASRRFRVDRVVEVDPTGERFEPPRSAPPDHVFEPGTDGRRVVISAPPSARWVTEAYDTDWTEEAGGRLRIALTVVGVHWLERLLVRLGPGAVVTEPDDLRHAGRDAAARLLAAYDAG